MLYLIFYGSYLFFVILGYLIYYYKKNKTKLNFKRKIILNILIFVSLFFIYGRFVETKIITINTTQIKTGFKANIVVISDLHLGIYKDKYFLQRVVDKINDLNNIDAVIIPGDFTFITNKNIDFNDLFSSLKDLKLPIYATLGNHDNINPGFDIEKELIEGLKKNNVIILENEKSQIKNLNIKILGLTDFWKHNYNLNLINDYNSKDNLIVITHNPDITLYYKNNIVDITISGHTHGGQIKIPFLYKKMIPCKGIFDEGFYNFLNNKLFVSSGLGEVGIPMRFLNPPTIDILELK